MSSGSRINIYIEKPVYISSKTFSKRLQYEKTNSYSSSTSINAQTKNQRAVLYTPDKLVTRFHTIDEL